MKAVDFKRLIFEDVDWISLAQYRLLAMGFLELAINLKLT
jgi:hypothetical protein